MSADTFTQADQISIGTPHELSVPATSRVERFGGSNRAQAVRGYTGHCREREIVDCDDLASACRSAPKCTNRYRPNPWTPVLNYRPGIPEPRQPLGGNGNAGNLR